MQFVVGAGDHRQCGRFARRAQLDLQSLHRDGLDLGGPNERDLPQLDRSAGRIVEHPVPRLNERSACECDETGAKDPRRRRADAVLGQQQWLAEREIGVEATTVGGRFPSLQPRVERAPRTPPLARRAERIAAVSSLWPVSPSRLAILDITTNALSDSVADSLSPTAGAAHSWPSSSR